MDAIHYLTWCEPAVGSLWSSYQDKEGKESLLDLYILKLSRFTAALTYCSFLSREYVLSVQCCVRCLGKHLCDSLEILDVSNGSPAMEKKPFWCFVMECLRRRHLFLMPFERFPSISQANILLMELFLGEKIIPRWFASLWNGASLDDVALQNRLELAASFSPFPLWGVWCAWAQIHGVLKWRKIDDLKFPCFWWEGSNFQV